MGSLLQKIFGNHDHTLPEQMKGQLTLHKRLNLQSPIGNTNFVAFDTELTGLNFRQDSIVSIGAVKLKGNSILPTSTFYKLVTPESELKPQSVVVHEITHSDLDQAEELAEVLKEFIDFIGDSVLIGHFVHIDLNFINRPLQTKYGISLHNPALDTASLHSWLYENDSRFTRHYNGMTTKTDLFSLAKKYGIDCGKAHNAFSDAFLTAQLFQRFTHFLLLCGIRTIKELLAVGKP